MLWLLFAGQGRHLPTIPSVFTPKATEGGLRTSSGCCSWTGSGGSSADCAVADDRRKDITGRPQPTPLRPSSPVDLSFLRLGFWRLARPRFLWDSHGGSYTGMMDDRHRGPRQPTDGTRSLKRKGCVEWIFHGEHLCGEMIMFINLKLGM